MVSEVLDVPLPRSQAVGSCEDSRRLEDIIATLAKHVIPNFLRTCVLSTWFRVGVAALGSRTPISSPTGPGFGLPHLDLCRVGQAGWRWP